MFILKKIISSHINSLTLYFKILKSKLSLTGRRKEITKIRVEINEVEKPQRKSRDAKVGSLKSLTKIGKSLARPIKKIIEKTQIIKIRNGRGDTNTNPRETQIK